jgi:chromosome segregation ATPase
MAKKSPARRKSAKKSVTKKKPARAAKKPAVRALPVDEKLREAMEEVEVARVELSRLGHEMTAAHRQLEEQRLSAKSARDNLNAQLEAMRTDLKTALAELEIARADRERIAAGAQKRIHELEEKLAKVTAEVAQLQTPKLSAES